MPDLSNVLLMLRDVHSSGGRLLRGVIRKRPELLEPRAMLNAVPIQFGGVYTEQDLGSDAHPDTIEISFVGGAPDTELTRIEIDGDKFAPGLSLADMLFDTAGGSLGADLSYAGLVTARVGEFAERIIVQDGSSQLTLELEGFAAGDKLVLSIDVDEMQGYDPDESDLASINEELDPIASGAEFQGSQLTAYFSAPHFHDTQASAEFRNRYDDDLLPTSLDLPLDNAETNRDRTAGAIGDLSQTPLPISVAGQVFEDDNANLLMDEGDVGIRNVALSLFFEQHGEFVFTGHTATTNDSGAYAFDTSLNLEPGNYQIRESQPEGYFSVGAVIGTVDGTAVGEVENDDVLTSIFIPYGGAAAHEYNFAEARPASIRGRVQLSSPAGDCFGETIDHAPVVGASVLLLSETGDQIAETSTDEEGQYEFLNLRPGEYAIVEVTPDYLFDGGARAGTIDGIPVGNAGTSRITDIHLYSGDSAVDYEFCEHLPARLSGSVYHDRDNDGIREAGEEGVANALLSLLDEAGAIVDTVETNDEGRYEFVGVRAGNFRVMELQPNGWLDGRDRAGTVGGRAVGTATNPGDEIANISLLWGDQGIDYDFGELQPASLQGRVHLSAPNGDCWDIDEGLLEPVAGAVVRLLGANGQVLAETTTDDNGGYLFGDLVPGDYSVRQLTPDGLQDGGAQVGSVSGDSRGTISNGDVVGIRLNSDEAGTDYDFCEHKPAVLSGFVFEDNDNDGQREEGEAPIAGVLIQLFDASGELVAETVTNENGGYQFEGLALGEYALRQIQPPRYLDGIDSAGTVNGQRRGVAINPGDQITAIAVGWGEIGKDFNFGELLPASISGLVHSSPNVDCWNDEDAESLEGVHIVLFGEHGRSVAETFTDTLGRYSFDGLVPGEYRLEQEQPSTDFDGGQRAGTNGGDPSGENQIAEIHVLAGDRAVNYDFCEVPPSSVSGFVFIDGPPIPLAPGDSLPADISPIRDGALTKDDTRLAGVQLELRNGINGKTILGETALPGAHPAKEPIRTTTDEQGFYEFNSLPKGNYAVYEIQPDGYLDGIDTPGTTDGIAINPLPEDMDEIFIETVISRLVEPPRNDAIVLIGVPPGVDSEFNNFSEVMTEVTTQFVPIDPPEPRPPLPSPWPELPALYQYRRDLAPLPLEETRYPDDGSNSAQGHTWHLSIIDGGQPRVARTTNSTTHLFPTSLWHQHRLTDGRWEIPDGADERQTFYFGKTNSIPVSGDFNGDGMSEIGIYADGHWYLDLNGNGRWDSQDLWAKLGHDGDTPVVGDWDGDGKDDIGIFGKAWPGDPKAVRSEPGLPDMDNVPDGSRKNMPPQDEDAPLGRRVMKLTAAGFLRADVIDHVFLYGAAGDYGVVGDWNGDGIDTVGVFLAGIWKLDVDGNGRWTEPDATSRFGKQGDIPLVGDFNGDGIDDLAIIRNGRIYIDSNGNRKLDSSDLVIVYNPENGSPVVGKWNGDVADQIAWFRTIEQEYVTVADRADTE